GASVGRNPRLAIGDQHRLQLSVFYGRRRRLPHAHRGGSLDDRQFAAVAKQGALDALAASRPGVRASAAVDPELALARAEIARLSEALKEMSVRLMLAEGKGALGLSGR